MSIPASPPLGLDTLGELRAPLIEHVRRAREHPAARGLAGAALLGLAAGHRSMAPLAALAFSPARRGSVISIVASALALAELVADKLPFVPDRTRVLPALVRALSGATAGRIATRRMGLPPWTGALAGGAAAIATTRLGFELRRRASRLLPPLVAALAEDLAAFGMAAGGVALARPR